MMMSLHGIHRVAYLHCFELVASPFRERAPAIASKLQKLNDRTVSYIGGKWNLLPELALLAAD